MGLLRQLLHWGPIVALTLITVVIISSNYSSIQLWSLPTTVYFGFPHLVLVWVEAINILWQYFQAMQGPGHVPPEWKPDSSAQARLQFCTQCQSYKPPRAHHCSICRRCVLKMDHHCPWVNTCVGHHNQPPFVKFLFFLSIGCVHAILINSKFLYHLFSMDFYYKQYLPITGWWLMITVAGIAFSFGACVGVLLLLAVQLKSITSNKTQIEDWIVSKANSRRREANMAPFVYPYDLGMWNNITEVINWSGLSKGDGIVWNIRSGCTQYTLTMEQLEQKKEKNKHAVMCEVTREYSGRRCCLLSYGVCQCFSVPCLEPTIAVSIGDMAKITRWRKRWVYGNIELPEADIAKGLRVRGWLPRQCVRAVETHSPSANTTSAVDTVHKRKRKKQNK